MKRRMRLVGGDSEQANQEAKASGFPESTSMFDPCEMFMLREHLVGMITMNLEAIKMNAERMMDPTPERLVEIEEAVRQREELLAWATNVPAQEDDLIFVALYPTTTEAVQEPGGE